MKINPLLFIFCFLQFTFCQKYAHTDSIVAQYPNTFSSISEFADKIQTDFKTDIEKTRAVYYWMANNISYDYKSYNSSSSRFNGTYYENEEDLKRKQRQDAETTLKIKIGVCEDYSQLFRFTLEELGIKCEVISGFAKTTVRDIGRVTRGTNHAWNAVYLDNKWQLIDVTWSTGNDEFKPGYFDFDDIYFLIDPKQLIWSHFPEDDQWQLLDKSISKIRFFYAPIIHSGYYDSGLKLSQNKGQMKSSHSIKILFNTIDESKTYDFMFINHSAYATPIKFIKNNGKYETNIPFKKGKRGELIIFDGEKACLSFKII